MDPLDRILADEEPLVPSSGFRARVMDAVAADVTMFSPLPFPWGRLAAGIAACLTWAIAGALLVERIDWSIFTPVFAALSASSVSGYAVLAVCGSVAIGMLPRFRNVE